MVRYSPIFLALLFFGACGDDSTTTPPDPADMAVDQAPDAEPDLGFDADTDGADLPEEMGEFVPEERTIFEQGPYRIGYKIYTTVYDAVGQSEREIPIKVWYPSIDEEGEAPRYARILLRKEVMLDAEPYLLEEAPVLVFSHGNSSFSEQSYFMSEYFASHGWIVIAPDHTGNTFRDTQGGISFESGAWRPQDITAMLDYFEGLDDDPIASKMSDDIVMTGHSFGGFTTLANAGSGFDVDGALEVCEAPGAPSACQILSSEDVVNKLREGFLDSRIKVAIPQTPGGFLLFQEGISEIDIPTLLMTAAMDNTLPDEEEGAPIWEALGPKSMRLDLVAGGHFTYSNMCTVLPFIPEVQNDGCGEEFIDVEVAFEIINAYSMAFARFHLFGDQKHLDLLNGEDARWAEHLTLDYKSEALAAQ